MPEFKPTAQIKMVIWDLDDTFWSGTLSEGGIDIIPRNVEIVRSLTDRGIISSICSKNNLADARAKLASCEIWDLFVFPKISFVSKGGAVQLILEQANLRPENVLFIDDNINNLEEIKFRFPKIMTSLPDDVLPVILDLPETRGKDDRSHSRLIQYRNLEGKSIAQENSILTNEEFLKSCAIEVRFDHDISANLERIIELINRSNQLNFTKNRVETAADRAFFEEIIVRNDIISAAIFVKDRYGDYGMVGFYTYLRNERNNRLIHFVFSCRIMNMGIEQFVYERLGSPGIDIVEPIANDICSFQSVNWITEFDGSGSVDNNRSQQRFLVLGGCDIAPVAAYCSSRRDEFVNLVRNSVTVRFDDFGFILNTNEMILRSLRIDEIPCWNKRDFISFRQKIVGCDAIILSLSAAMRGAYIVTEDNVVVRVHPEDLGYHIDTHPFAKFVRSSKFYAPTLEASAKLLLAALNWMAVRSKGRPVFLVGVNTRNIDQKLSTSELDSFEKYNSICREFCNQNDDWSFVSVDEIVDRSMLVDSRHFTRLGHFEIAKKIISQSGEGASFSDIDEGQFGEENLSIVDMIRSSRRVSRMALFGRDKGLIAHVKRLLKVVPVMRSIARALFPPPVDPIEGLSRSNVRDVKHGR